MRVKCLGEEHNTMSPTKAQSQTTQSEVEGTNHEATKPPNQNIDRSINYYPVLTTNIVSLLIGRCYTVLNVPNFLDQKTPNKTKISSKN